MELSVADPKFTLFTDWLGFKPSDRYELQLPASEGLIDATSAILHTDKKRSIGSGFCGIALRLNEKLVETALSGKAEEAVLQFGNGKKLKLSNAGNWIKGMALQYLNARLGLCDMESVLEELEDDYPEKKKAGRRQDNPELDIVLMGAYNLLKQAGFIPRIDYLQQVDLIGDNDEKNKEVYIRSKISFLLKTKFKPVWYNSPNMKADPVEMEWLDKLEDEGKVISNDGFVLHPILAQRMFQGIGKDRK